LKIKHQTLYIIFICVVSTLIINPAFSATYYVKNGGNNSADGLSDGNAWATIGQVNSVNFANGDIVSYNKGDTFDDANLTFAAITNPTTKTITITSYGTGALPWIGGDKKTIYINNNNQDGLSLVIENIKIDSQEGSGYPKIYLVDVKNVTIDGVTGDGSVNWVSNHMSAILMDRPGVVEVKNCTLSNWGGGSELWDTPAIPTGTGLDRWGIGSTGASGSISIHDNDIQNIESDGVVIQDGINVTVYDNYIWNCGENSADIKGCDTAEVYNNTMGRDATFVGCGGSSTGETLQGVMRVGDYANTTASTDIIIRDNAIGPTDMSNLQIGRNVATINDGVSIYNNYCYQALRQIQLSDGVNNLKVYNNIFSGLRNTGMFVYEWAEDQTTPSIFYNNTFYVGTDYTSPTDLAALVQILDADSTWKYNIFRVNDATDVILYVRSDSNPTFEGNYYNNAFEAPADLIEWKGMRYNFTSIESWIAAGHIGAKFANEPNPPPPIGMQNLQAPSGLKIAIN